MSTRWAIAVLVASALPCMAVTVMVESIPLDDPALGWRRNGAFFLRMLISVVIAAVALTTELEEIIPELAFSWCQMLFISCTQAVLFVGTAVLLAELSGVFPTPFGFVGCVFAMIAGGTMLQLVAARHRIPAILDFRARFHRASAVIGLQAATVIIYPVYTTAFARLPSDAQNWSALLLPAIKHVLQVAMRAAAATHSDAWAMMTGAVHQFHVLFTVVCIQNAKTRWTMWIVLLWHAVQVGRGCYGVVYHARQAAGQRLAQRAVCRDGESSAPVDVSVGGTSQASRVLSLLERRDVAIALFRMSRPDAFLPSFPRYASAKWTAVHREMVAHEVVLRTTPPTHSPASHEASETSESHPLARVMWPTTTHLCKLLLCGLWGQSSGTDAVQTTDAGVASCVVEIQHLLQAFHLSEHVLLRSCLSVTTYCLYGASKRGLYLIACVGNRSDRALLYAGVYKLAVYSFGNREYIVAMLNVSSLRAIRIVAVLLAVELVTLAVYLVTVKLSLGDSGLSQLAFVLSSQRILVQGYMISMTIVVFAMADVHFGYGFTFGF